MSDADAPPDAKAGRSDARNAAFGCVCRSECAARTAAALGSRSTPPAKMFAGAEWLSCLSRDLELGVELEILRSLPSPCREAEQTDFATRGQRPARVKRTEVRTHVVGVDIHRPSTPQVFLSESAVGSEVPLRTHAHSLAISSGVACRLRVWSARARGRRFSAQLCDRVLLPHDLLDALAQGRRGRSVGSSFSPTAAPIRR